MTATVRAEDGLVCAPPAGRAAAVVSRRCRALPWLLLLPALASPLACRSGAAAAPKSSEMTLNEVTEDRPAPPPFERLSLARSESVEGFDFDGAQSCLPLAKDRSCLERHDAVADACLQAHGKALRCEDCRILCSTAVDLRGAAGGPPAP